MRKLTILIIGAIILGLIITLFVHYQENKKLKNSLGMIYASNISNFSQHINHIETYLQNEKELKESDLNHYYYDVNYLLTVGLPSDSLISSYIGFIQNGLSTMSSMVSEGANNEEIEIVRDRTLQFILTLKEGLDKMSKVGRVAVKDGFQENYKEYYELSLPESKIMKLINTNLEKQLKTHMEILNQNNK